ncbi:acylphosphatase [Candidatus Woesearchaeota archaeon]|nr:acylphosphatase [Candidatus Woesearchaeota archaeon]
MQLKIILEGEVQGVFFRAFIKEMAKKLNLKGYVKNIENNVEIHAKGEKENIDKLIASCKIGPNGAKVNNIKVILENETNLKDFTIE